MTNLVCTCYQQTPQDGWFFKFRILTLTEMPQHFVRAKCPHTKKYRYVDKLTWKHHFLAELQEPSRWRTERSKNDEQTHSSVVQKLRFEFNIDFKHPGVSLCSKHFFKCEITRIIANLKTILNVNVTKEKRF